MTRVWRPLFTGEMATRAMAVVEDVARATADATFEPPANVHRLAAPAWRISLDGLAGQSLLQAYLALHAGDDARADAAIALLDRAMDTSSQLQLAPSLYFGFPGISWVATHLAGRIFDESEDNCAEVDAALLGALERATWGGKYDLFEGLVGIGVYALERLPRPSAAQLLEATIARLHAAAEHGPEGAAFFSPREHLQPKYREMLPNGTYNLGVAHGVAGVIALLGGAWRAGLASEQTRRLLVDSITWLLARERPEGESRYPNTYNPDVAMERSRLAWCHGDLGVAMALLVASRGSGVSAWEAHARRIGLAAAARAVDSTPVPDGGICHGTAGIGHIFNCLYQETGEARFAEAAHAWLARTLALHAAGTGIGGYQMVQTGKRYDHPGFRIGSSGIALALLAASSPIAPAWDRLLLAS